jgi:glycosyltransferase involved in cell wall biosynthesis
LNDREPEVSVIVPAWNAAATIGRTLDALAAQGLEAPYEVIVADDDSDDDTAEIVERRGTARLVRGEHGGPAAARNRGVGAARADLLAFTDADCYPTADWLEAGLASLADADLVQGAVRPDPGALRGPFDRSVWVDGRGGLFETANLLVRRSLFDRLGGFEDWLGARLGKPLAEDVWLGWRARRAGARVAYCEEALVHHAVIRRGPVAYVGERARLVYYPEIVARIPELRDELLWRRLFLNRRTAAFDAAAAGLALAASRRSRWPLLLAAPYAALALRKVAGWRRLAPLVAAADVAADSVGAAALAIGSARGRSPVL